MNLPIKRLFFFAFLISPCIPFVNEKPDSVINFTSRVREKIILVRKALLKYEYDPMSLPNISHQTRKGQQCLENGTLTGASNVIVSGDWTISVYGTEIRNNGSFSTDLNGTFTYKEKFHLQFRKYKLNVFMKNVEANMEIWFSTSKKILYNPAIKVTKLGGVQMFLEQCQPNFKRRRFTKTLQDIYTAKIISAGEKVALKLGEELGKEQDIIALYISISELLKEKINK